MGVYQMTTRCAMVVRRVTTTGLFVLHVSAGVAPVVCIFFFGAEHLDLFFALVVQVVLAPPDPPPRGSVAVFLVCVAFR